ncbi:MAG: DUF333 domain-containing protein [Gemmobacter sp.]|nr:DUF333 domain-containing protein [Gemmobacter sp.]
MRRSLLLSLACLALLSACGGSSGGGTARQGNWASMSNPAARYCADLGGRLELRQEQAGEAGYCHLKDGSVVEEWQLYRGRNSL